MYLRLSNGEKIDLPNNYSQEERLDLVNEILAEHPEQFKYDSRKEYEKKCGATIEVNRGAKDRLDRLGEYLLKADSSYRETCMTTYKEKTRPIQEMAFSNLSADKQVAIGVI